jgi:hypothetical protein
MLIPSTWQIPNSIRNRLGTRTVGRQRAIIEEGQLLLVLHNPPGPDQRERDGVLYWRNPAGEWNCNRGGSGPGSLKRHVQQYAELEVQLNGDLENAAATDDLFDLLEKLVPLVRSARNLYQAIQSARDAFKGDAFLIEMRDLSYDVQRNFELLELDARNAVQHRMARDTEKQAQLSRQALRASHRLNILAALFFPIMALSSMLGMNLNHGLDPTNTLIFWTVFTAGIVLGVGIMTWVLAPAKDQDKAQDNG